MSRANVPLRFLDDVARTVAPAAFAVRHASLGKMLGQIATAGIRVPPGFVMTPTAGHCLDGIFLRRARPETLLPDLTDALLPSASCDPKASATSTRILRWSYFGMDTMTLCGRRSIA